MERRNANYNVLPHITCNKMYNVVHQRRKWSKRCSNVAWWDAANKYRKHKTIHTPNDLFVFPFFLLRTFISGGCFSPLFSDLNEIVFVGCWVVHVTNYTITQLHGDSSLQQNLCMWLWVCSFKVSIEGVGNVC